jgi:threonine aldolase
VVDFAKERGWRVHLDGARLFDAAVALGVPATALTRGCDTVMFCLSKGLSCPAGSLLCGSVDLMAEAHELRRRFGGAMRQSGILAAAGLVALSTGIERLADDHRLARKLAARLAEARSIEVDPAAVETNMVWFRQADREWPARCAEAGVRFVSLGDGRCRAVCHRGVDEAAVEQAARVMIACLKRG